MKSVFNRIRNWSNRNQGLLTLLALIVAIISIIPYQSFNISLANPILNVISTILIYQIRIPTYLLLILIATLLLYTLFIRRKFGKYSVFVDFMVGRWRNQWGEQSNGGYEDVLITKDGKYIIDGKHIFDIREFQYNQEKQEVRFIKVAVSLNDDRKLFNILKVMNNELLVGKEGGISIKYSRINS